MLERTQDRRGLTVAEVAEPSRQVDPERLDHLPKAGAVCPPRQLPDLCLASDQRLRRDPPPGWRLAGREAEAIGLRPIPRRDVSKADRGSDSRFVITSLAGAPRWLYEEVYCARGQAENLIKAHKLHLASDRTSCSKATANQFRLLVHTAAYWLLHTLRGLAPARSFWREAQFDTIRLALVKVAARVTELATRIKVALPSAYPYRESLALLTARAAKLPP